MPNTSPSYNSYKPSSDQASKVKAKNISKNTKSEILLRKYLWNNGLRYRLHNKKLPGKPDITFSKYKLAIFCDGDFWHGRDWPRLKRQLLNRHNSEYWINKIKYNVDRDKKQNVLLKVMGWKVMRIWETDILKDPSKPGNIIIDIVKKMKARD